MSEDPKTMSEQPTITQELDLHVHIGPFIATQDEEANVCHVCQCTLRAGQPALTLDVEDDFGPFVCCMECGLGHVNDLLAIADTWGLDRTGGE